MFAAWVLCPLALALVCLGLGLVVERAAATRLPWPLLPGAGLAGLVVGAQLGVAAGLGAWQIVAALLALAAVGLALGVERLPIGRVAWPCAAAAGAFAVYAAPILLAGEATFAGYRRLDDTATWLAITDHALAHGRDLSGLAPSTHEATLAYTLGRGYPVGAFLPLAVLAQLTGEDPAWLIQPYMAALAAILALSLWALSTPLRTAPALRALAAGTAASAALLYGHYLSGAVKELLAAALLATAAALAAHAGGRLSRALLPLGLATVALAATLSFAGLVWAAPAAAAVAMAAWTSGHPRHREWALAAGAAGAVAVLSLVLGGWLSPLRRTFTGDGELGNLSRPLELPQLSGIWPAGDFRAGLELEPLAAGIIATAAAAAVLGFALAWRARATGLVVYAAGAVAVALSVHLLASPWLAAKALAIASPAVLLLAMLAAAAATRARPAWGSTLAAVLVGGVIWSIGLAAGDAELAPRGELAELERIGDEIAGEGPTLLTAYEPYGARHFLRQGDAEGVGELRRRRIPLRGGGLAARPEPVPVAQLRPGALRTYRTLVIDRSLSSRPPPPYERLLSGERYEVWQRTPPAVEHTSAASRPERAAPLAPRP